MQWKADAGEGTAGDERTEGAGVSAGVDAMSVARWTNIGFVSGVMAAADAAGAAIACVGVACIAVTTGVEPPMAEAAPGLSCGARITPLPWPAPC